ncbi:hypothetical protein QQM39_21355 [Streptomyces sp. DT2A-34]|uniref:hypothetical protein n=1 Tax=Streptomyces sp. DT2A-34 TaxID=3051182 RepID=UPI00265BC035|nr:hypothetical protein [Streptomyces sp. DT2A-34]MDO0913300.1 hypothetical protein [Streptomyces sp. DT2A-34]
MPVSVAVTPLAGSGDGPAPCDVGVADGALVGAAGLLGVRDSSVRESAAGSDVADSDGTVGVGDADRGDDADGVGIADGAGGVVRPLAGGGARGGAGEAGPGEVPRWSGSATSTATAQVTPAPIAVRTSRRRDARRRMAA